MKKGVERLYQLLDSVMVPKKISDKEAKKQKIIKYITDAADERGRNAAVNMLVNDLDMETNDAKEFVDDSIKKLTALQGIGRAYIQGLVKWHVEGLVDLTDEEDLSRINTFLVKFFKSPAPEVYDRNFRNSTTGMEMTFKQMREIVRDQEASTFKGLENASSHYNIKEIKSMKDLEDFRLFVNDWCIAEDERSFNDYAEDGTNRMFVCYADDYKDIKPIEENLFPRDKYGLSVICVIFDSAGDLSVVASRWNSNGERERFLADAELKQVIGEENFNLLKYKRKKV